MTTHGICIPNKIAAKSIDSLNRSVVSASTNIDNGWLVALSTKSTTSGQSEVWTATEPATGTLANLWMAYSPEIVVTTSGTYVYKGLDPDPRNFINLATYIFDAFKPQVNDIITLTGDCLAGTKSTNTYVNATDSTGGYKLYWGSTQTASVLSLYLLATTYISVGTGAIDNQRITAYQFEVVGIN
jgi:hypothetical protein